jgi:hypothetical protein
MVWENGRSGWGVAVDDTKMRGVNGGASDDAPEKSAATHRVRPRQQRRLVPGEDLSAEVFAAVEVAAGLRPVGVDGAKQRGGIEGDARPVAALVHATCAVVFDNELLWHRIACSQLDHLKTAAAATGAGRKVGVGVNGAPPRQPCARIAMFGWAGDPLGCESDRCQKPNAFL